MYILLVDNDPYALRALAFEIRKIFPDATLQAEQNPSAALQWVKERRVGEHIAYVFLETRFDSFSGIELASQIKELHPDVHLLFCTDHTVHAYEAFCLHAKGYLRKPVSAGMITDVLNEMIPDWQKTALSSQKRVEIHTFGHFEVYVGKTHLVFEREKAKELLAYLVDRCGSSVTTEQIAAVLWENQEYNRNLKNKTTTVISSLRSTLRKAGIEDILVKTWNHLALDTTKVHCDSYDYEKRDIDAMNAFRGEYMVNYSWAEFTTGRYIEMERTRGF